MGVFYELRSFSIHLKFSRWLIFQSWKFCAEKYNQFPFSTRSKKEKKILKKHYINNTANPIMWVDMWVVKLDFQR